MAATSTAPPVPADLADDVAQILDPALRVGDAVTITTDDPAERATGTCWTVVETIDGDDITVRRLAEKTSRRETVVRSTVQHYDLHLNRRPGHTRCISPACTGELDTSDYVSVVAWPDQQSQARRANWRWVQACPTHVRLAVAYATTWAGPGCLLSVTDSRDRAIPTSRWTSTPTATAVCPLADPFAAEQLELF